jgi:hypothetical protein
MITKQQVRAIIKTTLNGALPLWATSSNNKLDTLEHIAYRLDNYGCNTKDYITLVKDYLNVRFIDLPDTIDEVNYIDILNAL